MENGFGQSIIQVDTEPAILQLAQEAAKELTIPWRQSSSHTHQGQGAVERLHKTLFAQVRAIILITIYRLLTMYQKHFCLGCCNMLALINRHVVHADGMTNYQQRWGVQYNSAICSFGEVVLADIEPITINKPVIRNKKQKTEGFWLGRTTNSDEHIIATKDNSKKVFYTRSLTRLTPELQWDKKLFDNINIPQMDTSLGLNE
eukprot:6190398-Amphidinium_carterae.2